MPSLDKEAMQHVEALSKTGKKVEDVEYNAVYVPDGIGITSLEEFQKFKNRFTGSFYTDSLSSFSKYVAEQAEKTCFVHTKKPMAIAIFDLGTVEKPLHARHSAMFEVEDTAAYAAVKSFANGRRGQEEFAEFLEDWMFCITCTDADGNEMDTRTAISAVRRITIDTASQVESELNQLSTTKSSLSKIEASSRGMPLPAWITFTCAPYKCIESKDIPIRISMNVKREEINFTLKISNFEKIQEDIAEEFAGSVSKAIGADEKLYLGDFSTSFARLDYGRR